MAHPTGSPRPGTSNVNVSGAGQTRSNEVLVPVGDGGRVTLAVEGGPMALVVDLVGTVTGAEPSYVALDRPVRAADTRRGLGLPRGLVRGPVSLTLPDAVPAGATGVLLNVTSTGGTAPGFVTVYPTGTTRPETSNLSFPVRLPQANEVLARVGSGRAVTLEVAGSRGASTQLVVDVVGYTTG